MNDVIKSGNIIKKIRDGKQLEEIALFARNCIFRDGPKDTLVLEILSYLNVLILLMKQKSNLTIKSTRWMTRSLSL